MVVVRLRSADFEEDRRAEAFQEAAAAICKLDVRPQDVTRFSSETEIAITSSAIIARTAHSACTTLRTSQLAAETGDNILLHIPLSGGFTIRQDGGEEAECLPGQIYVDPNEVAGVATFHPERTELIYVSIPRAMLLSANGGLNRVLRDTDSMTPQWRMFLGYAQMMHAEMAGLSAHEAAVCGQHLSDLALMAFGAGREAEEIAQGRGVRAARLKAIKADIEGHLTSQELSTGWIAARHGVSERYIRALFADEQTRFRDYVAQRRLLLAHRMLSDPAQAGRGISDIAMSAGFGDLSWFNALFKGRFGYTPSEARWRAAGGR